MLKKAVLAASLMLSVSILAWSPQATSEPGPSPEDKAREDLTRVDYPSQRNMRWYGHFMRPQDSLESLFGKDWVLVARFNRLDRRHAYPGMTIKVPVEMGDIREYTPMPREYAPARRYAKYILINMEEQWLGAYERGVLRFSMPAATGTDDHKTPTGLFRVEVRHRNHTSSLYKTDDGTAQYPMDYAMLFHYGPDNTAYWIHARDLPGRPASHGCVGLYDEPMQNRLYRNPVTPQLHDSRKLYEWAVGEMEYGPDSGDVEPIDGGPMVEIVGDNPRRLDASRNLKVTS
jgi:hypothetical protein